MRYMVPVISSREQRGRWFFLFYEYGRGIRMVAYSGWLTILGPSGGWVVLRWYIRLAKVLLSNQWC